VDSAEEDSVEIESPSPDEKYKLFKGVVPKDLEQKKEIMSFIAYPQHLENACKLISHSKVINLSEGPNDKNRIFISGNAIMSTKLTVSLQNSKKICQQIEEQEIFQQKIKRTNVLEKQQRLQATQKMKSRL
jgi:hypothetical protein